MTKKQIIDLAIVRLYKIGDKLSKGEVKSRIGDLILELRVIKLKD